VGSNIRARVAQLVWVISALSALLLAMGALLIALEANRSNDAVHFILRAADFVDLDVFSRSDGIKQFRGEGADTKNALFNWGLGAIAWLVAGRIVSGVVKP
jgi:hypothetical protein